MIIDSLTTLLTMFLCWSCRDAIVFTENEMPISRLRCDLQVLIIIIICFAMVISINTARYPFQ
jgi:ABC-type lipoprotein release transport system permease subunit